MNHAYILRCYLDECFQAGAHGAPMPDHVDIVHDRRGSNTRYFPDEPERVRGAAQYAAGVQYREQRTPRFGERGLR